MFPLTCEFFLKDSFRSLNLFVLYDLKFVEALTTCKQDRERELIDFSLPYIR